MKSKYINSILFNPLYIDIIICNSNKSQVQVKLYRSYLYMYIFINILISLFYFTHLIYHIFNNFLVCL